ncbi:MAG TPA: ectoine/hydroxyectoine ABC transporter permease subunit EhuD [Pseudolabrys sp.]|nr:ectoine/hydroxyectoine ABC transporter permease subunit EhuD [Pseudolabrys sp.]
MNFDFHYAWSIVPALLEGVVVTLEATLTGMVIAIAGGLTLAIARLSRAPALSGVAISYIEFFRLTPLLVQLFFIFYVLPSYGIRLSGFTCGVIGLGLYYSAYMSEVFRAAIESIPRGQWEAATALSYSRSAIWKRIILPQTPPIVIPILANYTIGMFKESALLATITVNELLGSALKEASVTFRYLETITLVGLLYGMMSIAASLAAQNLERYFARHR